MTSLTEALTIGLQLEQQGHRAHALELFQELSAALPEAGVLYTQIARNQLLLDQRVEAEATLRLGLQRCPADAKILTEALGRLKIRTGALAEGLDLLSQSWGVGIDDRPLNAPALDKPIALFAFNRPEPTAIVFEAIRRARPPVLLLVADGPRLDRPGEAEHCAKVREVMTAVDWPCEIHTNFADSNMGCRNRVSSGLDWVFETVEEAIILEDDTVPHPSFFPYVSNLLDRYRDEERVGLVGGTALHSHRYAISESYYFSRIPQTWGWATWRRAWRHYDVTMASWPRMKQTDFLEQLWPGAGSDFFRHVFERTYAGEIDTWDYQVHYMVMAQGMFTIVPRRNLVTNIGLGPAATHTHSDGPNLCYPWINIEYPLRHPTVLERDTAADATFFQRLPGENESWVLRL